MGQVEVAGSLQAGVAMLVVGSSVAASSVITDYPILGGQAGRYALGAAVLATLNRPGIDGGSDPWRGWSHVSPEEVSPRAW
jgi:hypothetical protein